MRNKFDLNKHVYHKSYGRMIIERYIEANLDEPDTENQYDCEYKYDYLDRKRSSLFKESELMSEEDYLAWELATKREEKLKNILKED
jgi:hypothetical protein